MGVHVERGGKSVDMGAFIEESIVVSRRENKASDEKEID